MFKKSFLKIVLNKSKRGLWGFMISDTDRPKRSADEKKIVGKSCRLRLVIVGSQELDSFELLLELIELMFRYLRREVDNDERPKAW